MKKDLEEKESILYHYKREGKTFVTPSLQIAIIRNEIEELLIESRIGDEVTFKKTKILHD